MTGDAHRVAGHRFSIYRPSEIVLANHRQNR